MSSMKGKIITEKQQSMIDAIEAQLDVHFFGADRHDACAFIGEWIEKLPPRKEMPIIKKNEHGECFVCQDPLKESFNFMDMVHKEKICEGCYVIRQHDKDWQHAVASLGTPKPKAKPKARKTKISDEPKKKTELPYTICEGCNNPIFTLDDWASATPDTCRTCHDKDQVIPECTTCHEIIHGTVHRAPLTGAPCCDGCHDSLLQTQYAKSKRTPKTLDKCSDCDMELLDFHDVFFKENEPNKPYCIVCKIKKPVSDSTCHVCHIPVKGIDEFTDIVNRKPLCYKHYLARENDADWIQKDMDTRNLWGSNQHVAQPYNDRPKPGAMHKLDLLTQPTKPKKRGNNMFNNIKSIMGDFGKITTGDFKLAFQGIAIRTTKSDKYSDGTDAYAVYDTDNNRMLDVMDFVLDVDNVLYKMPVALNTLKQGDIILVKDKPLVVKSVNVEAQSVRALNPISNNEATHKPAGNLFGFNFITKVTSMFDMMQPTGEQAGFNPMMLMALSGDKSEGLDGLLPLMMMGGLQGGTNTNPMQQMLPLMLMSDKSGDSGDMMQMMMMSQMFTGQQGGANPFGALFGQAPVAPAPAVPTPTEATDVEAVVDRIIAKLEERLTPATDDSSQDTESK